MSVYIQHSIWAALYHSGVAGMKWGYNYGKPNGKRKAEGADPASLLNKPQHLLTDALVERNSQEQAKQFEAIPWESLGRYPEFGFSEEDVIPFQEWLENNGLGNYTGLFPVKCWTETFVKKLRDEHLEYIAVRNGEVLTGPMETSTYSDGSPVTYGTWTYKTPDEAYRASLDSSVETYADNYERETREIYKDSPYIPEGLDRFHKGAKQPDPISDLATSMDQLVSGLPDEVVDQTIKWMKDEFGINLTREQVRGPQNWSGEPEISLLSDEELEKYGITPRDEIVDLNPTIPFLKFPVK